MVSHLVKRVQELFVFLPRSREESAGNPEKSVKPQGMIKAVLDVIAEVNNQLAENFVFIAPAQKLGKIRPLVDSRVLALKAHSL